MPPRDITDIGGRNPLTGARVANLSPAVASELGFDTFAFSAGVVVLAVERFSPAQQANVRPGDVILEVNGAPVKTVKDLVGRLEAATQWRIVLRRGDRALTITARS